MTTDEAAEIVRHWFADNKKAGLILPDGWLRRPGDWLFDLTFIEPRRSKLIIELSDNLLLTFTELKQLYTDEERNLVFEDFGQFVLDWTFAEPDRFHINRYLEGEVKFML